MVLKTPPSAKDAARRLLILLGINSHALRLMMVWDFTYRTREAMRHLTGQTPTWHSLGYRGQWLRLRARWNWLWERRAIQGVLKTVGLFSYLTVHEREFLRLGLSQASRDRACEFLWQIEGAACIGWALRLLPRLWPMDEQFDGKLDTAALGAPERRPIATAALRPLEELEAAREQIKLWHWRARQFALEREGFQWPPPNATQEEVADLQRKGLATIDGLVRATTRCLREDGKLEEAIDDDFVARGKAYRHLTEAEASELLSIATERHKALNWLCGIARDNEWDAVPTET
jgi:hypothetical protein